MKTANVHTILNSLSISEQQMESLKVALRDYIRRPGQDLFLCM